jgi:hypothetical protein
MSETEGRVDDILVRTGKEVRFTSLSINVRMGPEERRKRSNLVPSHEHLRVRVAEETTDIGWRGRGIRS